eukprot:g2919.t1
MRQSYLQEFGQESRVAAELKIIVVDDFFLSPLSKVDPFVCGSHRLCCLDEAEDYLLEPLDALGIDASCKILHCYDEVVTNSGLVLQVGTGLSSDLLKEAKQFLLPPSESSESSPQKFERLGSGHFDGEEDEEICDQPPLGLIDLCPNQLGSRRLRRIAEAYKSHVSRPYGSSITQALFHTGLIPGETDFRIYRDFGDIPGADFAVLTNGWVYHTWRDDLGHLDFRSVQRYGETVFEFATGLAKKLKEGRPHGAEVADAAVFFDVGGLFFVEYAAAKAQQLHVAVGSVAVSGLLWFGGWRVLLAAATPVGLEGTVTASGPLLFGRDGFQSS